MIEANPYKITKKRRRLVTVERVRMGERYAEVLASDPDGSPVGLGHLVLPVNAGIAGCR